ncbi:MAG: NAD(P)H-hydrate dehydratase [Planctomycetota bacterium]|nr:NAD(P)H-hydrate dehydratase [Planctomycetota bacterium]
MESDFPNLPPRPESGHKGTFGTVCVLGGQAAVPRVMIGGPAFSALGALRSGCGLAILAVPEPIMNSSIEIAPSATGLALPIDEYGQLKPSETARLLDAHASRIDCLAVGPGLGEGEAQQQIVMRLISQDHHPLVLDADAINAMAQVPEFRADFHSPAILTPHPGEYQRIASGLGIETDPADPDSREEAARNLASQLGCVVVLKGKQSVVSDGVKTWVNSSGGPALATAGTGDVLTGLISGFVAQFFKRTLGLGSRQITPSQQGGLSLFECAQLGVFVHGKASDAWSETHGDAGMLATDLLDHVPGVLNDMRGDS